MSVGQHAFLLVSQAHQVILDTAGGRRGVDSEEGDENEGLTSREEWIHDGTKFRSCRLKESLKRKKPKPGSKVFGQLHQRLSLCSGKLADREDTVFERDTSVHHRHRGEQRVGGKRKDTLLLHTHGLQINKSKTRLLAIKLTDPRANYLIFILIYNFIIYLF